MASLRDHPGRKDYSADLDPLVTGEGQAAAPSQDNSYVGPKADLADPRSRHRLPGSGSDRVNTISVEPWLGMGISGVRA